jgi:tRNA wybutosine-synthesizing protein 2
MSYSKPGPRKNLSLDQLKNALKGQVDLKLNGWEILGDLMVVQIAGDYTEQEKRLIGEKIIELHPKAKTVLNRISIDDELREPKVEVLAGEVIETIYKENGSHYKIDPTKVMFSFGNKDERKRMSRISSEEEIVLDMFACVGQFTIPIAKFSFPKKVVAVEKNPVAYQYLVENIKLNKLGNVETLQGDCRDVCPLGLADRVILGYLFETEKFLPTALNSLKKNGGTIHYHFVSSPAKIGENKGKIIELIKKEGYSAEIIKIIKVKSYAPRVFHWVFDLKVIK